MRQTKEKQIFKKMILNLAKQIVEIRDKLWTLLKLWDIQVLMLR